MGPPIGNSPQIQLFQPELLLLTSVLLILLLKIKEMPNSLFMKPKLQLHNSLLNISTLSHKQLVNILLLLKTPSKETLSNKLVTL
jgi:hypothetical protein